MTARPASKPAPSRDPRQPGQDEPPGSGLVVVVRGAAPGGDVGSKRGPATLPAAPVVAAVLGAAKAAHVQPGALFGPDMAARRAFQRARGKTEISLGVVDQFCAVLRRHPTELYGSAYEAAAARRVTHRPRPRPHHQVTVPLATYQAIWDRMAAAAVDGCWTGALADATAAIDPELPWRSVRQVMTARGWLRCERRSGGRDPGGRGRPVRPSTWRLLRRPDAADRPCEVCHDPIPGLTADGFVRFQAARYCSEACRKQATAATYIRELDLLREAAGLAATGRQRLSALEIREIRRTLRRLRMTAA
jgi:hypothetical protein